MIPCPSCGSPKHGNGEAEQRYDIRAAKDQDDEVGTLIDGFNDMLSEIEHRDRCSAAIRAARRAGQRRTAELAR